MEQILITYYEDNAKKLHKTVDQILLKFGGLSNKDLDDFYSLANEVFVNVMKSYNGSQSFDTFLYSCLRNKIKTEVTRRNREKRGADRLSVSIDTPIGDDEDCTLGDLLADSFDMEREVFKENEECYSRKMTLYLDRLSAIQREILKLTIAGYVPSEIREELRINEKQYADCITAIHSYRNVSVLF